MSSRRYTFNQLSFSQFVFLIYKTQIGISVLTLPGNLVNIASTDGLLSIFLGYLIAIALSFVLVNIMQKHPGKTLFDILPQYFGKWIGNTMIFLWMMATFVIATLVLYTSVYIIQMWILPNTQFYLLATIILIPVYLIVKDGLLMIGRSAEFVFLFALWMPFLLLFALKDVEWYNLLPFFKTDISSILGGSKITLLSFFGFELAFLYYPFLRDKKKAFKGIVISNTLTLLVLLVVTLICFLKFTPEELKISLWPTLNILKLVQFPFLERWEVIFLSFYLYVLLLTVIPYLYNSLFGITRLQKKKKDHRPFLLIVLCIWILLPFLYDLSYQDVSKLESVSGSIYTYFVVGFIIFFWGYVLLYNKLQQARKRVKT